LLEQTDVDGVQLLVAMHGRAERAAPEDVVGEVAVVGVRVVFVEAGLQFLGETDGGLGRLARSAVVGAERRAGGFGFVRHGVPPGLLGAWLPGSARRSLSSVRGLMTK
jgi:hypothetical protein